ncbi:MAG TPA: glutamine--fructose-6-phosphate aminotransferase [Desulfobacteraceae bacterium]|nr:glutamine--fructose-6-phosphate aminotransferase [Desulfobacteraceae bacterium]
MKCLEKFLFLIKATKNLFYSNIYFGKSPWTISKNTKNSSIIFFPYMTTRFCCGITGIVAFHGMEKADTQLDLTSFFEKTEKIKKNNLQFCIENSLSFCDNYLGGKKFINSFTAEISDFKKNNPFFKILQNPDLHDQIKELSKKIKTIIDSENKIFFNFQGELCKNDVDAFSLITESLLDIFWFLSSELLNNLLKVQRLVLEPTDSLSYRKTVIFKNINTVLNSLDFLEVRGRDSAGISLMFTLGKNDFQDFDSALKKNQVAQSFKKRLNIDVLANRVITLSRTEDEKGNENVVINLTYKFASEVGNLGDNTRFLRQQICEDTILHILANFPCKNHTVSAHTRWASVGAINEPNCHPVDSKTAKKDNKTDGIIHVCLNGDIDNYRALKKKYAKNGYLIHEDITTDTKIIPIIIKDYFNKVNDINEAFRLALNDFKGSHAISMHTDLAPGKIFLAQRGSGQAIFVGLAEDSYIPTSEVYGFVEETSSFLKLNGETDSANGQIFILDQESKGGLDGISAIYYDGTPVGLEKKDIKQTEITSRDIDRQEFPHYFLKEISESHCSVERTLLNRWKINQNRYFLSIGSNVFPNSLQKALSCSHDSPSPIKRVFFIGQGTAGVAAKACANILNHYMDDPSFTARSFKSSELSGMLNDFDNVKSMADVLVIAISQSGTTTDTNRTMDMVKERGASTVAIVNRRDSDITFKVDGVMYTSTGRDIEMSVASTKAFYSQITAGALLSLNIAVLKKHRDDNFVDKEIRRLLEIPFHMKKVLKMKKRIKDSAYSLALSKTYWATVGSGPNKVSSDEIRIKLSELCYKTISSDYVEDKKHIDLSSEPLIIVCAAGANDNVIDDIVKDTSIFHSHKSSVVVIANEGEDEFEDYADDVIYVPPVYPHLAPILNTLAGHLWGYYAALAINEGSTFLDKFRSDIQKIIDQHTEKGLNVYEIILEDSFKERTALFYREFRSKQANSRFLLNLTEMADLTLLLKYLMGRLPVTDFDMDFGKKGTALNILNLLFEKLGNAINNMARPVDAIKHQAKTVTVGTTRVSEKIEGIIFDCLAGYRIKLPQLSNNNIIVLKNIQRIVAQINGSILYKIAGLNILGEPTDETTIKVIKKDGALAHIPSRVEDNVILRGTKQIIVRRGNVFIGKGRHDDRSFIAIPLFSDSGKTPNSTRKLLLLNISLKEQVPLLLKIKALGGKYKHIKNIVQENNIKWEDSFLNLIDMHRLFGKSAEKIGESIVANER